MKEEAMAEAQRIIDEAKKQEDDILRELDPLREDALVEAQKIIDNSNLEAERINGDAINRRAQIEEEIERIKGDAINRRAHIEEEIERINGDAFKEKAHIEEEINVLKEKKVQFQDTLKNLIETHLKLLENESNND